MKHVCPHCGEKTFSPLQKALCGSLRGKGKPCPSCGKRCCNGMGSIYFSAAISGIAFAAVMVIYLFATEKLYSSLLIAGIIIASLVLNFVFNMFFGKLTEPIRIS